MVRRLLIVAFSLIVAATPLANTFCFEGCNRNETPAHHACASHPAAGASITASPKACATGDAVAVRNVEARRSLDALPATAAITVRVSLDGIASCTDRICGPPVRFHSTPTPLRI